jgi:hypothetical protein
MVFRSMCAAAALLCAVPAAALDVIASFTPVSSSTGNFAPVSALLTGLVEGNNIGSNIGFSIIASPLPGSLGGGYTPLSSEEVTFGDRSVALTVTNGIVTKADFFWRKNDIYFAISKNSSTTPQIVDFGTYQYADTFDGGSGTVSPTVFSAVPSGAVPEPASWAMLIAGFGLVGAMQRRRAIVTA